MKVKIREERQTREQSEAGGANKRLQRQRGTMKKRVMRQMDTSRYKKILIISLGVGG